MTIGFEAKNKSIFIEEITLFVDYSNFMFSLFILVTKGPYLIANKVISFYS